MDERGTFHLIEDDLAEGWVDDWVADGVEAIEEYLAKHLAFLVYLDGACPTRPQPSSGDGPRGPSASGAREPPEGGSRYSSSLSPSDRSSAPFGMAPTAEACGSPFSNRIIIGIEATP